MQSGVYKHKASIIGVNDALLMQGKCFVVAEKGLISTFGYSGDII